jgi:hypothetical protein
MRRQFFASLLLALSGAVDAAPSAVDVDALVSYETRQVLSNGVERTERWSERLIRRGDTVWAERVLPAASHDAAAEPAGHKHFDFDRAARLVTRDASGATQLRFVDREHRVVVSVPKAEYGAVGFDGRWDAAASIVPAAVAQRMQGAPGRSGGDARWRTERAGGWSHRVLWSDARQLAMRVESQRDDGSVRRIVSVTPTAPGALPWVGITGYTQKEYDDFMD